MRKTAITILIILLVVYSALLLYLGQNVRAGEKKENKKINILSQLNEPAGNMAEKIKPSDSVDNTNEFRETKQTENQITNSICANAFSLGELIALDDIFEGSAMLEESNNSLRDLLIIDSLLNNKCVFNSPGKYGIEDLFIIDRLLGGGGGLLQPDKSSLEDLIILDQIFNGR